MAGLRYSLGGPASSLVNATIIGIIICIILVSNRIYWRAKTIVGLDDYLILLSLCLLITLGGISLTAVNYGYGRVQDELSVDDARKALLLFFLYQLVYKLTITTTKLSVIILYLRIFREKNRFRIICLLTAALVTSYTFIAILVNIFECHPISRAWNPSPLSAPKPGPINSYTQQNSCINIPAFWLTTATINLSTEITILLSSIFVVSNLELPSRQKIALVAVLTLGVFVFITSILRVTTLQPSSSTSTSSKPNTTESTYRSTLWSTIEASTAIICACLPMLRTLIQKFVPEIFGSLRETLSLRSDRQHHNHNYRHRHRQQSSRVKIKDEESGLTHTLALTSDAAPPGTTKASASLDPDTCSPDINVEVHTPARSRTSRGSNDDITINIDIDIDNISTPADQYCRHQHQYQHQHNNQPPRSISPSPHFSQEIKLPKRMLRYTYN